MTTHGRLTSSSVYCQLFTCQTEPSSLALFEHTDRNGTMSRGSAGVTKCSAIGVGGPWITAVPWQHFPGQAPMDRKLQLGVHSRGQCCASQRPRLQGYGPGHGQPKPTLRSGDVARGHCLASCSGAVRRSYRAREIGGRGGEPSAVCTGVPREVIDRKSTDKAALLCGRRKL